MKSASSFVRHVCFPVVAFVAFAAVVSAAGAQQKAAKSDDPVSARLQRFEDKEEIQTLLLDYGRHLDNRDFAAYSALFPRPITRSDRPDGGPLRYGSSTPHRSGNRASGQCCASKSLRAIPAFRSEMAAGR